MIVVVVVDAGIAVASAEVVILVAVVEMVGITRATDVEDTGQAAVQTVTPLPQSFNEAARQQPAITDISYCTLYH